MKKRLTIVILFVVIALGTMSWSAIETSYPASNAIQSVASSKGENNSTNLVETELEQRTKIPNGVRYRLDASQSHFTIDANSSGVLWFLGHNHHIAARDFKGDVELSASRVEPAALQMTVKTESLAETGEKFTEQQKQIINNSMHKEVLETAKYPEAVFKSTNGNYSRVGSNRC
jgi:polyisoprenoid-binding protein YceI